MTDSLLFRHSDPDGMENVDDPLKYCIEYCDGFATFPSLGSGWDGKVDDAVKNCVEYVDGYATCPSLGSGWDGKSRRCA